MSLCLYKNHKDGTGSSNLICITASALSLVLHAGLVASLWPPQCHHCTHLLQWQVHATVFPAQLH